MFLPLATRCASLRAVHTAYFCFVIRLIRQVCLLDIDIQGVKAVKASSLTPKYVFIAPPSMEVRAYHRRLSTFRFYDVHDLVDTVVSPHVHFYFETCRSRTSCACRAFYTTQALEKRLRDRGTENEESLSTRMRNAREEMEFGKSEVTLYSLRFEF